MRRPALLIVFAALFCGNTRAQDGILTGFNPGPSYTPGFDGIVVAVAPTDPNAGPTQFDVGKTIRLDVWWNSVDRLPNIASTFRFHVDTPGAQIVNEFGALDTCAPFLGGGQVASLGGGGDVFSYFFRYSTPGIKTIAVTVSICSGGFNPAKVAVLGQAGTIQVGGPSSAQITPQALNFPGSLNPIIVPPGGGQLSTPLNLKLG